ncbi:unnamed protein product [Oikopleura dioica]|uniref:UBC core domain-containing protein n=1 Tax=Oikopleura dioica TaxID=34765 RepID=E4XLS0_OIKDI|nr:unnamed protein product [Oikopleura dioica]
MINFPSALIFSILKDLPEQSSILTTLKYIVDRVINAFKLEIEPVVLSADEESLLEKECSSCSDDLVESKEKLSNLSLSEEENEDDTDSDTGDEFLDDLNWQAEKKPVDDNEGLDSAHVSVLDKLQVTATKSLGHYQRSKDASVTASDRLLKELRAVYKSEVVKQGKMTVEPIEDNIYELKVVWFIFDPDSALAKDLAKLAEEKGEKVGVEFRFHFSADYPFDPPFVRVVSPKLVGGHVFRGGAICMELLTKSGWSASYMIETVCMQLSATIVRGESRVLSIQEEKAILEAFKKQRGTTLSSTEYSLEAAKRSFRHIEQSHQKYGWNPNPKS